MGPAQLQAAPQAAPGTALYTSSVTLDGTGLTRDSGKNDTEKALRTVPGGSAQGVRAAANNLALSFAPARSDSGHIQQPEGLLPPCRKTAAWQDLRAGTLLYRTHPTPICFFPRLNFPLGCLPVRGHPTLTPSSPFPVLVLLARRGRSCGSLRILLPLRVQPLRGERSHAGECPRGPSARGRCAHAG